MATRRLRTFTVQVPAGGAQAPQKTGLSGGALAVWNVGRHWAGTFRLAFGHPGDSDRSWLTVREGDTFSLPFGEVWYDFTDAQVDPWAVDAEIELVAADHVCHLPERAPRRSRSRVLTARFEPLVQFQLQAVELLSMHLWSEGDWCVYTTDPTIPKEGTVADHVWLRAEAGTWERLVFQEPAVLDNSPILTRQKAAGTTDSFLVVEYRPVQTL